MFGAVALCCVLCGIQIRVLIRASTRSADLFWLGIQIRVLIRASTTIRAGTEPVLLFDWRIAKEGEKLGMRGKGL